MITASTVRPFFFLSVKSRRRIFIFTFMPACSCQNRCHIFPKGGCLIFFQVKHCSSGTTGTPCVPYFLIRNEKASQCHANDKEMTIRSGWGKKKRQDCVVVGAEKWLSEKRKRFSTKAAVLLSRTLLSAALCLGRQALKRLLFGSGHMPDL